MKKQERHSIPIIFSIFKAKAALLLVGLTMAGCLLEGKDKTGNSNGEYFEVSDLDPKQAWLGLALREESFSGKLDSADNGEKSQGDPTQARLSGVVLVALVYEKFGAHRAGVKKGDTLLSVADAPIPDLKTYWKILKDYKIDDTVRLVLRRNDSTLNLRVVFMGYPYKEEILIRPMPGQIAPALSGRTIASAPSPCKVCPSLLMFFSPSCEHCSKDMPGVVAMYRRRGVGQANFRAVSLADSLSLVQYIRTKDIPFDVLQAQDRLLFTEYRIFGVPTYFILDREGVIHSYFSGSGQLDKLEKALLQVL